MQDQQRNSPILNQVCSNMNCVRTNMKPEGLNDAMCIFLTHFFKYVQDSPKWELVTVCALWNIFVTENNWKIVWKAPEINFNSVLGCICSQYLAGRTAGLHNLQLSTGLTKPKKLIAGTKSGKGLVGLCFKRKEYLQVYTMLKTEELYLHSEAHILHKQTQVTITQNETAEPDPTNDADASKLIVTTNPEMRCAHISLPDINPRLERLRSNMLATVPTKEYTIRGYNEEANKQPPSPQPIYLTYTEACNHSRTVPLNEWDIYHPPKRTLKRNLSTEAPQSKRQSTSSSEEKDIPATKTTSDKFDRMQAENSEESEAEASDGNSGKY